MCRSETHVLYYFRFADWTLCAYRAPGVLFLVRWIVEVPGGCICPVLHPTVHRVPAVQ